jgi:hypothetical protein
MDATKKKLSSRLAVLEKKYNPLPLTDTEGAPLYDWNCLGDPAYCPCPKHLDINDALIAIDTLVRRLENAVA